MQAITLQKCLHPSAFEDLLRSQFIHGFGKISFFTLGCIEREQPLPSAALLRPGLFACLRQEMFNEGEEKGAELATLLVNAGEIISL